MRPSKIRKIAGTILLSSILTTGIPQQLISPLLEPAQAQNPDPRQAEADRLLEQGKEYLETNQLLAAFESWQKALALYRELDNALGVAQVRGNLAVYYRVRGEYTVALQELEAVLQIMQNLHNLEGERIAWGQLGLLYRRLGNADKAKECLQRELEMAQAAGEAAEMTPLNNLGLIYIEEGKYEQARANFERQLEIARRLNSTNYELTALTNLGLIYEVQWDFDRALFYYEQILARVRGNPAEEGGVHCKLGRIYLDRRQFRKAVDSFKLCVNVTRATDNPQTIAETLNALGTAYIGTGELDKSEKSLYESIEILESLREGLNDANKVSIFELQINVYANLQNLLLERKKIAEALELTERGRARALVELLRKRLGATSEALPITYPKIAEIKQIAREQNATIVEYWTTDPFTPLQIWIWVVNPQGKINFRKVYIPEGTSIKNLVPEVLGDLGVRGRSDISENLKVGDFVRIEEEFQNSVLEVVRVNRQNQTVTLRWCNGEADAPQPERPLNRVTQIVSSCNAPGRFQGLKQLHQLLIEPIAEFLPTDPNDRVIFIPHKELFAVPFPALQDNTDKFLIEKHTILTAPAIQVLALTRQQREKVKQTGLQDALVVGNPTMPATGDPPQPLAPLPNAETEAIAIAPLLNTQPLIGNNATKNAILQKLPQARWIHLATHGILDETSGLSSAIALAPSGSDKGFLTAAEILNLNLNAELVVLSACETAKGRITGDGIIGLSRSLIAAGVPSVIVSLWQVPDAPTAALMTAFYQNMQQNPDKARALRQAMLSTIQQHPEPKNWAAFTLIGESE
ncbi:MAG: hypothetical protein Fur0025_24050 [Oscillatoriaceae cyanobacterium]